WKILLGKSSSYQESFIRTTVLIYISIWFSARSYPRHACPLYVVVFMQVHDLRKSPPVLAGLSKNDPQTIMQSHAA
ncbi:TPA: hypothetical protein ACSP0W_005177, partial [Escherichia coli]